MQFKSVEQQAAELLSDRKRLRWADVLRFWDDKFEPSGKQNQNTRLWVHVVGAGNDPDAAGEGVNATGAAFAGPEREETNADEPVQAHV